MMTIKNPFGVSVQLNLKSERTIEVSLWKHLFEMSQNIINWDEVPEELTEQYNFGEINAYDLALQMYSDHESKKYYIEMELNPIYELIIKLFGVTSIEPCE